MTKPQIRKRMLYIKEKPDLLLLLTAIVVLLAFVLPPLAQIDFQDKTMFSVPLNLFTWIIPLFIISLWLLYLLTKKFLYSKTITWIHILVTNSVVILIVLVMYIGITPLQQVSNSSFDASLIERQELIGNTMQILFIIFVFGQFLFPANVLVGIFSKNK